MAKKSQDRKNSRAARRLLDTDSSSNLDLIEPKESKQDAKARVFNELANKKARSKSSAPASINGELVAITMGQHPDQQHASTSGRVSKGKKNKKDKRKQDRAEALKDMLSEKINLAKQRHKTIRNYREADEEKDSKSV